jgi:hypothetical protein
MVPQSLSENDTSVIVLPPDNAGWSSQAARRAHNPEVTGSNPVPATTKTSLFERFLYCPY